MPLHFQNTDCQAQFGHELMNSGLGDALGELGEADILVTDIDVGEMLRALYPDIKCRYVAPSEIDRNGFEGAGRILVLVRYDEFKVTRLLRARHTEKTVLSFVYDIFPRKIMGKPYWTAPDYNTGYKECSGFLVLFSSQKSNAGWFSKALGAVGVPAPIECGDKILTAWLSQCFGFRPLRFFASLCHLHNDLSRLSLHIRADFLGAIISSSYATTERVASWFHRHKARAIYFTRRDKFAQTSVALFPGGINREQASDSREASEHTASLPAASATNIWEGELKSLLVQEALIEDDLAPHLEQLKCVSFEEFLYQPQEVLKSLAIFLARKLPRRYMLPEIEDAYLKHESIQAQAQKMRRHFCDVLGLRLNGFGSLNSPTDNLFRRNKH